MSTSLKLHQIATTAGTQIRAKVDADTVDRYAEAMRDATNKFPPIVVYHDGSEYILADGFHRVMAATRNSFLDIEADVRKGTRADALRHALGANAAHGLPRTNADKRRSVELALQEWPTLSDREIERICCVSDSLVASVRKDQLPESGSSDAATKTRVGRDGKRRKLPSKKSETKPRPSPEPVIDVTAQVTPAVTAPEPPPVAVVATPDQPSSIEELEKAIEALAKQISALAAQKGRLEAALHEMKIAQPDAVQCDACLEVFENDHEAEPLYECNDCGNRFTPSQSDYGTHRCSCGKFAAKVSDQGCPECGQGELSKPEHKETTKQQEAA